MGYPIFVGWADGTVTFGGTKHEVRLLVVRDEHCTPGEERGSIGGDVLKAHQWEVDPVARTMTLRKLGANPRVKPLARLKMRVDKDAFVIGVKIRNVAEDVQLMLGSSYVQAGPALQRKWDLLSGKKAEVELRSIGDIRVLTLKGDDNLQLSGGIVVTDIDVALMGDARKEKNSELAETASCVGQGVLNRFVYSVDAKRKEMLILERVKTPEDPESTSPGGADGGLFEEAPASPTEEEGEEALPEIGLD